MKTIMNMLIILYLLVAGYTGSGMYTGSDPSGASQKEPLEAGSAKRDLVQRIYNSELGIREKSGKNDGTRVEEYLRQVGLKKGDPWCAAFVCWVFDQAGIDNPHSGWAASLFPRKKLIWERSRVSVTGKLRKEKAAILPQRGDVFGIWFPEKKRIAHAGFVDSWNDQWLITVEGNTNEAGSREGDGVYRKRRLVKSIYLVAKYIE